MIIELLTVNVAVRSAAPVIELLERMGLQAEPPKAHPEPPAQIVDVTFPFARGGAISLIEPTASDSPVGRFIERRGTGTYSVALRVDDLRATMREWADVGVEWILPEPQVFPWSKQPRHGYVERLLGNWTHPRSVGGFGLEVFQFDGEIRDSPPEPSAADASS